MEEVLQCEICFETFSPAPEYRRPVTTCKNGHLSCQDCFVKEKKRSGKCPHCRDPLLAEVLVNRPLLAVLEKVTEAASKLPQISTKDIEKGDRIGDGAYADVFGGKWHSQKVAIKILRQVQNAIY